MSKLLFKISRLKFIGFLVGFGIAYLPFLVPVKKIKCNKRVFAFLHPAPSFPNHTLVIPRKIAKTIFHLSAEDFYNVVSMALQIRNNDRQSFTLLINGGTRQDVMQSHFHLFTGDYAQQKKLVNKNGKIMLENNVSFWKQFQKDLPDFLNKNGITDKCFSVFVQFKNDSNPTVYVI